MSECVNWVDKQNFLTVTNECLFLLHDHWIEMIYRNMKNPIVKLWKFSKLNDEFLFIHGKSDWWILIAGYGFIVHRKMHETNSFDSLIGTALNSWAEPSCVSVRMPFFSEGLKWMLNTRSIFIIDNIVISDFHWLQNSRANSLPLWPLFKNLVFLIPAPSPV